MARLMFIQGSRPLAGARVRFNGSDRSFETDEEGRLAVKLNVHEFTVEVETDEASFTKKVNVDPKSSLTVVNVEERTSDNGVPITTGGAFNTQQELLEERYDFLSRLGSGGMAVVIKAKDKLLERMVAIKILSEDLAGYDEARDIFMREARSLATLSHRNLVSVYDVIDAGNRPMMVTEFVDGMSLEEAIRTEAALPQSTLLEIGVQTARAIEYLHGEGLIHRDLKPGNIMLQGDGNLKIIDFGLARSLERLSNKGTRVRGTPAYMAPEQIKGGELTGAVDIYQLGVTLYEVASGSLPFSDGDVGYKHVHEEPPFLGDVVPNILPGLAELVSACLAKDPSDRPASVTVLREELERLHGILTSSRIDRKRISEPNVDDPKSSAPSDQQSEPGDDSSPTAESAAELEEESGAGDSHETLAGVEADQKNPRVAVVALLLLLGVGGLGGWALLGSTGGADGTEARAASGIDAGGQPSSEPEPEPTREETDDEEAKMEAARQAIGEADTSDADDAGRRVAGESRDGGSLAVNEQPGSRPANQNAAGAPTAAPENAATGAAAIQTGGREPSSDNTASVQDKAENSGAATGSTDDEPTAAPDEPAQPTDSPPSARTGDDADPEPNPEPAPDAGVASKNDTGGTNAESPDETSAGNGSDDEDDTATNSDDKFADEFEPLAPVQETETPSADTPPETADNEPAQEESKEQDDEESNGESPDDGDDERSVPISF